jgi:hypothetical protein
MNQYCRWCDKQYTANSKQQVYCSIECRQIATKENTMQKRKQQKFKKRINKRRLCSGCGIEISIYNEFSICNSCYVDKKKLDKFLKDMRYLFEYEKK